MHLNLGIFLSRFLFYFEAMVFAMFQIEIQQLPSSIVKSHISFFRLT